MDGQCCCSDVVDTNAVSRRRSNCARWSVVRRCSTKLFLITLLFVFFTLTTLYTSPSSTTTYRDPGDGDTPASSSVVLLPRLSGRHTSSTSASGLLAMPDCDAIIAGDQAEIASTRTMLFRETRTFDANRDLTVNCTSTFQRSAANVDGSPTSPPLAYIISDDGNDVEQTELLLRAVYAAANIYCLTFDFCSASDHAVATVRRLASCFNNIIVVERTRCTDTILKPSDWKRNATTTAWWRCVDRLLRCGVDWTHVVGLTAGDFPLRPQNDIARRLTLEKFDVVRRTGNDVIQCGAYTRTAVSQPSTLLRTRGDDLVAQNASLMTTSKIHSPDGASAIELCTRKCANKITHDDDNVRCYYTIADLPSLVRQRKLFAHVFNLNVDHYAVRCLMQRVIK